jgi:hypothetical protein
MSSLDTSQRKKRRLGGNSENAFSILHTSFFRCSIVPNTKIIVLTMVKALYMVCHYSSCRFFYIFIISNRTMFQIEVVDLKPITNLKECKERGAEQGEVGVLTQARFIAGKLRACCAYRK